VQSKSNAIREDKSIEDKKRRKVFTPPTVLDVKEYFFENGYTENSALKAFEYYNIAEWHDSKGNKVKNWKQKMQSVWFKEENKIGIVKPQPYNPHGQPTVTKVSLPYKRPTE
jgi:hypothetical protein